MSIPMTTESSNSDTLKARKIVGGIGDVLEAKCEDHDFQFVPTAGAFCSKCNIAYGVECLKPGCRTHYCKDHNLTYDLFCGERDENPLTYANVLSDMRDNIYCIHLAHCGIAWGEDEDIRKVFSFPNLRIVEYCDYTTDEKIYDIMDEFKDKVTFVPIL